MEIHRELGKGHDEIIYKDAFVVELSRAGIPFLREKNYEITYKGVVLPHYYYADFVVWDKILLEAKAIEKLSDSHVKQLLNYLAASKLRLGLLVNFGSDSLGKGLFYETRNFTNSHETLDSDEIHTFVTIRVIASRSVRQFRDDSCPKFVAISVIGVYDAGAVTND
jgi:GxxExxY protein